MRQLKNGAQLNLDSYRAYFEVTRRDDARRGITHHQDFARQLRRVAKLKVEVDRASTRRRLLAVRDRF